MKQYEIARVRTEERNATWLKSLDQIWQNDPNSDLGKRANVLALALLQSKYIKSTDLKGKLHKQVEQFLSTVK